MGPVLAEIARTGFSFYPVCIHTAPQQSLRTGKKNTAEEKSLRRYFFNLYLYLT